MANKVTVFEFVTKFNTFYNNILHIIEESYNEDKVSCFYLDIVYDKLSYYKNEIERTLEARVLSVDKAGKMLMGYVEQFVKIAENCAENYNLVKNEESYEAYKFLSSVVDCYNEMCEEVNE